MGEGALLYTHAVTNCQAVELMVDYLSSKGRHGRCDEKDASINK